MRGRHLPGSGQVRAPPLALLALVLALVFHERASPHYDVFPSPSELPLLRFAARASPPEPATLPSPCRETRAATTVSATVGGAARRNISHHWPSTSETPR